MFVFCGRTIQDGIQYLSNRPIRVSLFGYLQPSNPEQKMDNTLMCVDETFFVQYTSMSSVMNSYEIFHGK